MGQDGRGRPVPATAALFAAVVLLAAVVRAIGLGSQALWWDEGWSIYFASMPLGEMLAATARDIHPPLYYGLLHCWTVFVGYSPLALRSLSLLCGLGLVASVCCLGAVIGGPALGLLAGLLAAVAPIQVFYSQEGRMYALLAALSAFSWAALLAWSDGRATARRWAALYVITITAALYTEYYAALLWLGQVAYVGIEAARGGRHRPRFARRFLLLLIPLLAYLPWLAYALPRLLAYVADKESIEGYVALGPLRYLWSFASTFLAGHSLTTQPTALWVGATVAAASLALYGFLHGGRRPRAVALCFLALPLAMGYLVNVVSPFTPAYHQRVLLFAAAPLYLLGAVGLIGLGKRGLPTTVAGIALAALAASGLPYVWTAPRYTGRDYRPVFAQIRRYGSESDAVLCVHPWQYGYALAYLPERLSHLVLAPTDSWSADAALRRQDLTKLLSEHRRVWFPAHQSLGRILENEIADDLGSVGYRAAAGWHGSETLLLAYARPAGLVDGTGGDFGPITLGAARYAAESTVAGAIPIELEWDDLPSGAPSVSLRLVDSTGAVWAALDADIEQSTQRLALLVPWGTPTTTLRLVAIASLDGVELSPPDSTDNQISVGEVTVLPASEPPPDAADLGIVMNGATASVGLTLAGYEGLPEQATQGDDLPVTLWWSLEAPVTSECVVFVQALDVSGHVVTAVEERIGGGVWPPTAWPAGTLLRDRHTLIVPARANGDLRIVVGLLDPATREPLALGGETVTNVGQVRVLEATRLTALPKVANEIGVGFGSLAVLAGYEAAGCSWQAGACSAISDELRVRLVWQVLGETDVRYRSFLHVLCDGEIVAQSDQQPGDHATTAWLPGEYVVDEHILTLPGDVCSGASVAVGLYDPDTEERLQPTGTAATSDRRAVLFTASR